MNLEICEIIENVEKQRFDNIKITQEMVNSWVQSDDLEILGMLYALLTNVRCNSFFETNIKDDAKFNFLPNYFITCILEDPDSEWADSRYTAAIDFSSWFREICSDTKTNKTYILLIVKRLADLYLNSNDDIKEAIINGFLEHVLHDSSCEPYFKDWKINAVLNRAYQCGINPRLPLPF